MDAVINWNELQELLRREECHMGMDYSSLGGLLLCEKLGIAGEDIMFTSNNTSVGEYRKAFELGATINLDDYSQIDNLTKALGGGGGGPTRERGAFFLTRVPIFPLG